MRTLKPLMALFFLASCSWLYAGNACFGTYTIHSSTASANSLSIRFESQYVLASGWSIVNETWNFGDGTTANGTAVTHTYSTAGQSYNACLVATAYNAGLNIICTDTICKTVATCNSGSIQTSTYFITNVQADGYLYGGLNFSSINSSIYPLSAYVDYGDGTISQTFSTSSGNLTGNANHIYTTVDTFVVNVYVTNAAGCVYDSSYIVKVPQLCSATASFTPQISGDTVHFNTVASSTNGILYYDWDFYSSAGYYNQSSLQSPTIIYSGPGPYFARLVVRDSVHNYYCTDTVLQQVFPVVPPCNTHAAFSFTNTGGTTYQFNNLSTSPHGYKSTWIFRLQGSAVSSSYQTNPQYTYSSAGTLSATLMVTDSLGVCTDSLYQVLAVSACDTFTNIVAGDVPTLYVINSNLGYAYGNNQYGDRAMAEKLTVGTGDVVNSIRVGLGKVTAVSSNNVLFALWDNTGVGGGPGNIIASANYNIQSLKTIAASSSPYANVSFTTPPVISTGIFYAGVVLPTTTGDTVALLTTNNTSTGTGRGWLQWSDNTWHEYDSVPNNNIRNFISAFACNACGVSANYTYTTSNDTVTLTNASSPLSIISNYDVSIKYASSGAPYATSTGAFNSINKFKLPQDTLMNVCLVARDTSGTCADTFCTNIGIWQPCAVVSNFTFTQSGSAILVYNASTGNYPPLTYQWQAPGAWPSSSTATDTAFYYPSLGTQNICLIATNAIGCKDTFCTSITTVPTDTLCGMVFIDANSNGIYDGGEQVRPNSTVRIDGSVFLTDNTGFYRAPVVSGPHVVSLIAPPGWAQTFPDTPLVYNITTNTGDHICGLDFGMRDDTLTLSGIAYLDNNGNGLYDAGDAPRANVPIVINGTNGSATVYTNSAGHYSYAVYSGSYTISSTAPVSHVFTQPYGVNYYNVTAYTASITGLNFGVRNTATTISGKVFIDANNNGVYDLGEIGAANQRVTIGGTYVYTNSLGDWSVIKPAAVYNASYSPTGSYMGYTQTSAANISVNAVTAGGVYPNNNFGIYLAPGTGDVCITLSPSSAPWPFSSSISYSIQLTNYGNIPMPGVLEMNFDPLYTYLASNTAPSSIDQANYTLRWNLTVAVGQTIYIRPRFTMPNTTPVGVPLFNQAFFAPDAGFVDVNMACNEDTLHQVTVTSYDPNDKYVSPIGQGNNHAINNVGQKLDYTIMFQNTGSAPAVNVILLDTVEADLDIESFVMKDASHDYRVEINGQEIQWTFNNIMLPDSNTSADSSIGFLSFSMKAKQNLAEGTLVTNRAGIYFDYNDVVATGTAFNTIETATSIADIAQGANISIQPNPFNAYTNLVITDGNSQAQYTLRVYDVLGKLVQQVHANTNIIRIERNNMQQGMYMYEVEQDNKLIGKGKLIAE